MAAGDGVSIAPVVGRRARRLPQLVHDGAALAAAEDVGRRAIDEESRTAIDIMTGHHATNGFRHLFPLVARMERSEIRDQLIGMQKNPALRCVPRGYWQPLSGLALLMRSNGPSSLATSAA